LFVCDVHIRITVSLDHTYVRGVGKAPGLPVGIWVLVRIERPAKEEGEKWNFEEQTTRF